MIESLDMKSVLVTSTIVSVLTVSSSPACDLCSVYSAAQARGDLGKGIYAGVAEQFTHYGTIQIDGVKVSTMRINTWTAPSRRFSPAITLARCLESSSISRSWRGGTEGR